MEVAWKAHKGAQEDCLAYEEVDEKLYGGGRGGGKTDAGMAWLIRPEYISHPKYRGLVIRRQSVDLSDWIDRARVFYAPLGARFVGSPVEIIFPSGATIRTGHLGDAGAYTKYQGHEYQRMLIEEASHIPSEDLYEKLVASCRSTIDGLAARVMLTSNPDGDGRVWLKRRFKIVPNKRLVLTRTEQDKKRLYIHSTVDDNPSLVDKDPGYIRYLEGITDKDLRDAWRNGSWETFSVKGAYYADLMAEAKKKGRVRPVLHQAEFPVDTYWDLGLNDSMIVLFVQRQGAEFHLIDTYEMTGMGLDHYAKILQEKPYTYGTYFVPHDIKQRELSTGKSRLEVFRSLFRGNVEVLPALSVDDGINAVRMRFHELWIDDKQTRFIEAIESYRKKWNDIIQAYEPRPVHDWSSHWADALRYWAIADNREKFDYPVASFRAPSY